MQKNIFRNNLDTENLEVKSRQEQRTTTISRFQTYLFEFGTDEKLYSGSFKGKILPEDVRKILKSTRNCLYANMAESILSYLEQHHLEYKEFTAKAVPLDHESAIRHTNILLHSDFCDVIDRSIGNADIYYGIVDHQQWNEDNSCEGCYSVVKRTISEQKPLYQYKIIGQTFNDNKSDGEGRGYFAIRTNDDGRNFHNINAIMGKSVIPTFGCVDMMALLLNIDNIRTAEQAKEISMK